MKKFYTLLALCLAGIMSMTAKDYYTLDGLNESAYPSVAEIQTGVDYFIGNARTNAESYLCTTGGTGSLSSACLYQFEEAGKDKEGTTTYFIKNVETGQYMGEDPSTYTSSRTRATQFTIMPGQVFNATPNPESGAAPTPWIGPMWTTMPATPLPTTTPTATSSLPTTSTPLRRHAHLLGVLHCRQ